MATKKATTKKRGTGNHSCVFPQKLNGKIYRYVVKVTVSGVREYIGCFKTEDDALTALNAHLEFRKENPIKPKTMGASGDAENYFY